MTDARAARLAGWLAMAAVSAGASANQVCSLIPNGSFDSGLDGWTFIPVTDELGEATASAGVEVADGSQFIVPFDEQAAVFTVFAAADGAVPKSAATAESSLSRDAVVTDRYLRVRAFGGWGVTYYAGGVASYRMTAIVHGPEGEVVEQTIATHTFGAVKCPLGLSIDGVTSFNPEYYVDVTGGGATGIDVGDDVVIEIVLRAEATGADLCDYADAVATMAADEIAFCDRPACPDLDGDRVVGTADLLVLLAAWGSAPGDPADLDGDTFVGTSDLLLLLAAWGPCG